MPPTAERVREVLDYNPEIGVFTWKVRLATRHPVGSTAGSRVDRYWQIGLDKRTYRAHQLAWLWVTGAWPTHEVDHIDGDTINNAFANLRDEPHGVNMRNTVAPNRNNTSGVRGVYWNKKDRRWQAQISHDRKNRYIGQFQTKEAAEAAYWAAKARLHGEETYQGRQG